MWPEHFDLAAQIDLNGIGRVTIGCSPGDRTHKGPYLYIGPPDPSRLTGPFWNAPFGALLDYTAVIASGLPSLAADRFIDDGVATDVVAGNEDRR